MLTTGSTSKSFKQRCLKKSRRGAFNCRFACASPATAFVFTPYMGFMVGQRYQCQDCQELMVIPLEFDEEEDYRAFRAEMLGDDETSEE